VSNEYRLPYDICRCLSVHCDRKESCLRFLARGGSASPYMAFDPVECADYIGVNITVIQRSASTNCFTGK
jgi:hypothetical protein